MKTSPTVLSILGLLVTSSQAILQGKDARPCDNQDDCPTVLCCGWAMPFEDEEQQAVGIKGYKQKICYKPTAEYYTNFNGEKYTFQCDPAITKWSYTPEEYNNRFWVGMDKTGPENIPGYGPENPYIPPIYMPESLITIYDRWLLTSQWKHNPIILGIEAWVDHIGTGDSWDGYWYNNAEASGAQLYPYGLSKYFDVFSTSGLFEYLWFDIWVVIQEFFLPFTFNIPVDIWLAWFQGANTDGIWKIFLFYAPFAAINGDIPSWVAGFFRVPMEDGWGILDN